MFTLGFLRQFFALAGCCFCSLAISTDISSAVWEPSGVLDAKLISGNGKRISGVEGNAMSYTPENLRTISADGRFVVFFSSASNLVTGDRNGVADIFLKDTKTGSLQRLSTDNFGNEANMHSEEPSISSDGRYVTFHSLASNLVPGDTNGRGDIFLKDMKTGSLERVSTDAAGNQGNGGAGSAQLSGDGRFLVFVSDATNLVSSDVNGKADVFIKNLTSGLVECISTSSTGEQGNHHSYGFSLSADNRFVVFHSEATNLVPGDTNSGDDVFVKDRRTNSLERISVNSDGREGNGGSSVPSISANGRFVAFQSGSSNLVSGDRNGVPDVFVKDRATGSIERASTDSMGAEKSNLSTRTTVSSDGRFVMFDSDDPDFVSGDTNATWDVFLKDMQTGSLKRVSTSSANQQGDGTSQFAFLSAESRFAIFRSYASNFASDDKNGVADVFKKDLRTGRIVRVSVGDDILSGGAGNGPSFRGGVSLSGQFSTFHTSSGNLLPGDGIVGHPMDVGLWDGFSERFSLVSTDSSDAKGNNSSYDPDVSVDGSLVTFSSRASNLVPGDRNGVPDVFVKRNASSPSGVRRETERLSVANDGSEANSGSGEAGLSQDGRFVVFSSFADNLVLGDRNNAKDVFLKRVDVVEGAKPVIRVSVPDGVSGEADGGSESPSVSADGGKVVFASNAENLVSGDTNKKWDVFVRNVRSNRTVRVSVNENVQGDGDSREPMISADGRYVVFASNAENLVGGDSNGASDVFVKDLVTGNLRRVSFGFSGQPNHGSGAPSISDNGRYIAFDSLASNLDGSVSDVNNVEDVFVKDTVTGLVRQVSVDESGMVGDRRSVRPRISGDGQTVVFDSDATEFNMFDRNDMTDVYSVTWKAL